MNSINVEYLWGSSGKLPNCIGGQVPDILYSIMNKENKEILVTAQNAVSCNGVTTNRNALIWSKRNTAIAWLNNNNAQLASSIVIEHKRIGLGDLLNRKQIEAIVLDLDDSNSIGQLEWY